MEDEVREKVSFIFSMAKATDKVKAVKPSTVRIHAPKDFDFEALDSWLKDL